MMTKTLEGVKVVDFTGYAAGPVCSKALAEYGAEVTMVEPLTESTCRTSMPHTYDFYANNKRSISLNLKSEKGKEIMTRMIKDADVFVHNYRNKAMTKLGLSYEDLKKINPRIIYASIDGYGFHGPDKDLPGYDTVAYWARSGMMNDFVEEGTMMVPPLSVGDSATAQALTGGICAALYSPEKTGQGMQVYASIFAEAIFLNHQAVIECQYSNKYPQQRKSPQRSLLNAYRCKDGKWVALIAQFDRDFNNLLHALELDKYIGDPRWKRNEDTMYAHAAEFVAILDQAFAQYDREEVLARLAEYDIACAAIATVTDVLADQQAFANQYLFKTVTREGKELLMPASPVKFGCDDIVDYKPGPIFSEHTRQVLAEYGYSGKEIEQIIESGVAKAAET